MGEEAEYIEDGEDDEYVDELVDEAEALVDEEEGGEAQYDYESEKRDLSKRAETGAEPEDSIEKRGMSKRLLRIKRGRKVGSRTSKFKSRLGNRKTKPKLTPKKKIKKIKKKPKNLKGKPRNPKKKPRN